MFCYIIQDDMLQLADIDLTSSWNNQFWMPSVDVPYQTTNFYNQTTTVQYQTLFYYSVLLFVGNDVLPQTPQLLYFCILIIYMGAFIEAFLIGSITAEMYKIDNK